MRRALRADHPSAALYAINAASGNPTGPRSLGMPRDGISRAVGLLIQDPYANPPSIEARQLRGLLEQAWAGDAPKPLG